MSYAVSVYFSVFLLIFLFNSPARDQTREVRIYLWDANNTSGDVVLRPVTRRITGAGVLKLTLESLFAGPTREEESEGLSTSTFGMKFEGVTLTNKGIAQVRFLQPPGETNYGSLGPSVFASAVKSTASQFSTVKRVYICAVGDTLIDSQLEKPFPKCPK